MDPGGDADHVGYVRHWRAGVQGGASNGNIIEIGWNVSPFQYAGDSNPHLFVFHWIDDKPTWRWQSIGPRPQPSGPRWQPIGRGWQPIGRRR